MPVPLRSDFDAAGLCRIARKSKDGLQARRLLALATIYEGASRTQAARIGGVTLQIVRDWVAKFNAHGPESLIDRKPPGQPSRLTHAHRAALMAGLMAGLMAALMAGLMAALMAGLMAGLDVGRLGAHGVVRWRLIDLAQWLWEEFRISISKQTLSRELRAMGYRKLSTRPHHHARTEHAADALKKSSRPSWRRSPQARPRPNP